MPIDPRLQSLVTYATDPTAALAEQVSALRSRVAALERQPTIMTGSGAPTNTVRDGTAYGDNTNTRLWLRLNGVWRFTTLT